MQGLPVRFLRRRLLVSLVLGGLVFAGVPYARAADQGAVPAAIKNRGSLVIGLEGTYPPFNYQDQSGQLVGFEVDFGQAVAKQLGLTADFRPTKWDGILAALASGRIDVVINQVTITPERQKVYDFSEPYTVSGIQIITRRGDEAKYDTPEKLKKGVRVGVGLGTNYEQWLRQNVPGADIRTYDDDPTKYQDLRAGRIDAVLNDRLVAADFIKKSGGPFTAAGKPSRSRAPVLLCARTPSSRRRSIPRSTACARTER